VQIHELKITLCGSKPPIWRTVAVPSGMRFSDLHEVIQIVMGWTNSHLHQFIIPDNQSERYLSDPEAELDNAEDERKVKLSELAPAVKSKFIYEYDFGDGWKHLIEVVRIGPPAEGVKYPVCLAGKLACPPDDCGGLGGYYNILEALKDPKREDYEDMLAWVGEDFDAERFDIDEINAALAKEIEVKDTD
jgi:Plasmid pRiA4b ORF-3-like protein